MSQAVTGEVIGISFPMANSTSLFMDLKRPAIMPCTCSPAPKEAELPTGEVLITRSAEQSALTFKTKERIARSPSDWMIMRLWRSLSIHFEMQWMSQALLNPFSRHCEAQQAPEPVSTAPMIVK